MARTARIKRTGLGVARYHLVSRTNNKAFLFDGARTKDMLVDSLRRAAEFSGVRLRAYVGMDNHFHIVCEVTRTEEKVSEDEVIRRVGILKGSRAAEELVDCLASVSALAASGGNALGADGSDPVEAILDRYRVRMNDVSQFVKTFKEHFDIRFKRENPYTGSIWSGRFTSTLVESERYLSTVIRYVIYNPVRAGIVRHAEDYRWSWAETASFLQHFAGTVPGQAGTVPNEEGTVPVEKRRRAQLSNGKVYGSIEFIVEIIGECRSAFYARRVGAHRVWNVGGYATHGHRLDSSPLFGDVLTTNSPRSARRDVGRPWVLPL